MKKGNGLILRKGLFVLVYPMQPCLILTLEYLAELAKRWFLTKNY